MYCPPEAPPPPYIWLMTIDGEPPPGVGVGDGVGVGVTDGVGVGVPEGVGVGVGPPAHGATVLAIFRGTGLVITSKSALLLSVSVHPPVFRTEP